MWAALDGHAGLVELLLERGAAIDAMHHYGGTALQYAVSCAKAPVVKLLLKHGADPNLRGHSGRCAGHGMGGSP
jgi:ankyrin repeat protein